MPHGVLQRSMVQLTAAYLALIAVIFFTCAGLGAGFNPAKAQLGGDTISSVTNTLGGAVSSVTTTVNNTLSNLTSTTGGATTGVTNTVNQAISPVLNSTLSTNVRETSG